MITHDLLLKAFSLQPIYLSSYVQQSAVSFQQQQGKNENGRPFPNQKLGPLWLVCLILLTAER